MRKSRSKWLHWTTAESRLVDRFAHGLVEGRFRNAGVASRTCMEAMARLNETQPRAHRAAAARTYEAVHTRILDCARVIGGRWPGARWSARQESLIRPFVTGLIRGRYESANEAARHAATVLEQSGPGAAPSRRRPIPFSHRTVEKRLRKQAAARGWRPDIREWSEPELRVLDDYGRAVKQGRYPTAREAARAYLRDIDRLARRYRGARWLRLDRTLNSVFITLVKRLKRLKSWSDPRWPAPELRLVDRFARRLVDGRYPTAREAGLDFQSARDEMRVRHPEVIWLRRRRSLKSARRVIIRRAHELGWSVARGRWAGPERLILDRYARAVARGRYRSVRESAPACQRVIARLHRLHPDARWSRVTRTQAAVEGQLQARIKTLGVPRNSGSWTPGEFDIVERFARRCGTPGYRTLVDATRECIRELERRHRRELSRGRRLGPVQPRTFGAVRAVLRQGAIALGTWGPSAQQR